MAEFFLVATCQSICLMGMQGMFSTQVYIRGPYNLRDLHASRRGATFVLTPERPNFQLSDASRCPRPFIHIQKVHFTAFGSNIWLHYHDFPHWLAVKRHETPLHRRLIRRHGSRGENLWSVLLAKVALFIKPHSIEPTLYLTTSQFQASFVCDRFSRKSYRLRMPVSQRKWHVIS